MAADVARFLADLKKHSRAVIDSNVLIYHLEGLSPYVELTEAVITELASGSLEGLVSTLTVAEILAGPYRESSTARVEAARGFLEGLPNTELAAVTVSVADSAAWLRGRGLRMPDALVMGTAVAHGADVLLTNDPHFRHPIPEVPAVLLLDDYCS